MDNPGWRAMLARGFAHLSPPEAEHAILELPTNRGEYVDVLQDIADYPARSPIGVRVPSEEEVANLRKEHGRWRAVVSLEDERALKNAAAVFQRVFVLDPFYDTDALLYAAWHDALINEDHSRRLAEQAGLLLRASDMLSDGTAVLIPDHLPGSWNPRPGWRKPRGTEDQRQVAAWAMRSGLVLLYWADRLDALVCTTRGDVIAALDVLLGQRVASARLNLMEPTHTQQALLDRDQRARYLAEMWADARLVSRRRPRYSVQDVAFVLSITGGSSRLSGWRVSLGEASIPDPPMLMRRVLDGQDPEREPPLPRRRLKRRPLCLMPL
jgi:hypothetical protein